MDNVVRQAGMTLLPCNWLQCMENSLDPVHVEWLHGYYMNYVWSRRGGMERQFQAKHKKIGFDRFEFGIIKRRVVEGNSEEDDPWRVGHPIIFPTILRIGASGNYRFESIRPAPYPGRPDPAHIHMTVKEPGRHEYWIDEVVFTDDALVTAEYRRTEERRGGSGTPLSAWRRQKP